MGTIALAAASMLSAGCRVAQQPQQPAPGLPLPARLAEAPAEPAPADGWLDAFADPALAAYVRAVLAANPDLRAAAARLETARLDARIAGAALWPQVNIEFNAARGRNLIDTIAGPQTFTGNRFSLGLGAAWEADLWGKLGDSRLAARADYGQAAALYRGAELSLAGNAAKAWVAATAASLQWQLAADNARSLAETADWIAHRYTSGLGAALDLRLARANAAEARATVQTQEARRRESIRLLETLLGRYPAGAQPVAAALPDLPAPVPADLPAALLERRPDLVDKAQAFTAASARFARARKDLLPSLRLTGAAGNASNELENVVRNDYFVWNLAAGLTQPLFRAGELRARRDRAAAQVERTAREYAATVLTAFAEVEQLLAAEDLLGQRQAALQEALAEAAAAEALAFEEYGAGLREITTFLDAQRRHLSLAVQVIDVRLARLLNRLNLHLALGGDFSS